MDDATDTALRRALFVAGPMEAVRIRLALMRARGVPFGEAWSHAAYAAVRYCGDRSEWLAALADTQERWRAAYEQEPATRGEVALVALGAGAQVTDATPRRCEHCERPLAADSLPSARYCRPPRGCRQAAARARLADVRTDVPGAAVSVRPDVSEPLGVMTHRVQEAVR